MWNPAGRPLVVLLCLFAALGSGRGLSAQSLSAGVGSAARSGEIANVPILLANPVPVDGLVMVFEWDGRKADGIELRIADGPGEPLEGADIVETRVEDDFMVLAVVVDTDGQGPETIPAGIGQRLGTARIECNCEGDRQEVIVALPPRSTRSLVPGGQVVDNLVVVDGRTQSLELNNGRLICNTLIGPGESPQTTCGALDENGDLANLEGGAGDTVDLCFFYRAQVTDEPLERIQGFSLSVSYDCELECAEESVDITGTVLEEVQAEFLQVQCDNDPDDGDGCELIAGMLVDLMPPFDGRTLPGSDTFRSLFCADFTISDQAACGSTLTVDFVDGLDGRGNVPSNNLVAINNFDEPFETASCDVTVIPPEDRDFLRGDCNFNGRVNVADAAAVISHLFGMGPLSFDPPCLDACDADDTGEVNIVDAMFLLNHLFIVGSPSPPPPGTAVAGPDPTADNLTCAVGGAVCP